ncbi:MAG: hypothetical protein DRJ01_17320 [Bacteroidetes bacterium]|nr:MAG: hypothetical protein DRJ01_17320 [Bacteroidota bacterium]
MRFFIKILLLIIIPVFSYAQADNDYYLKACAEYEYKNYQKAIDNLDRAIAINKNDENLFIKRGNSYYFLHQYNKAIESFLQAEKIKPSSASFYLAKSFAKINEPEKSIHWIETNLNSKYKVAKGKLKLDADFNKIEKTLQWQKIWNKKRYTKNEIKLSQAEYLIKNKEYNKAINELTDITLSRKRSYKAYSLLGKTYLLSKNYKSSIYNYTKAIKIKKNKYQYYYNRAKAYYKTKKYKKSLSDINTAIKLMPTQLCLYYDKALYEFALKNYEPALADAKFYLKYFYKDYKAIFLSGQIYYEQNDYLNALLSFNKTLTLHVDAKYFVARGNTYLKTKTYKYAEHDYAMALDLNPRMGNVYFNKGIARLEQGNKKGACYDFMKALDLGYMKADDYLRRYCLDCFEHE